LSVLLDVVDLRVDLPTPAGMLRAVRGIDLTVSKGETLCIVGESGCGKSLTSLTLMGLLPRFAHRRAARMQFEGTNLLSLSERALADIRGDRMAMIFQEPMTSLNPAYTIGNQLAETLRRHRRLPRRAIRDRVVHLLERVGITAAAQRLGQYPHQLSGGLRQRVMIAMALMCEPDLLIADEPTTALDVTIQAQILHLLAELRRENGLGMVLITHDLGVVARVADRVAVMYGGEFVETGTVEEVFRQPLHPYTQGLLACIPVPGRTARGQPLGTIPGVVPSLIEDIPGCIFRERCSQATDLCRTPVPVTNLAPGRTTRCHLVQEGAL